MRHRKDYEALEVAVGMPKSEIRKAFKKLAILWHPDKARGQRVAPVGVVLCARAPVRSGASILCLWLIRLDPWLIVRFAEPRQPGCQGQVPGDPSCVQQPHVHGRGGGAAAADGVQEGQESQSAGGSQGAGAGGAGRAGRGGEGGGRRERWVGRWRRCQGCVRRPSTSCYAIETGVPTS